MMKSYSERMEGEPEPGWMVEGAPGSETARNGGSWGGGGGGEELGDFYYSAVGVDGAQLFGGGDYLGSPHVGGEMDDLALKVAFIHYIAVHQAYCSHSRRSKIHRHRGAKSAAAYNEHPALSESLLSFPSYFLQQ